MIHHVPSPQLKSVRSPFSLPSGASIGASRARPGLSAAAGHHPVEPGLGVRAGDLEAREAGDVEQAHVFAHGLHSAATMFEGVGAFQGRRFLEAFGARSRAAPPAPS
jgi:hypothetical protein